MAFHNRSADISRFSMVPRADIPRSVFQSEQTHKTTFDSGWLVPIYIDEILPGDTMNLNLTAFCRLSTPIVPVMDNLHLDTFFFFVPNRLVWSNWRRFMGEQSQVGESTTYMIPTRVSPASGWTVNQLEDYFGIPPVGQVEGGQVVTVNALPFRAYNLIWNEWFRDENLQTVATVDLGNGPDVTVYGLLSRGKRHDYFTSCLPWPQKPTSLDLSQGFGFQGGAPVSGLGATNLAPNTGTVAVYQTGRGYTESWTSFKNLAENTGAANHQVWMKLDADGYPDVRVTINDMRQAFAVQRLLERDARGGTRYGEIIRSHFGVISPDARLQRPEYLGGGSSRITVAPVAQTSATKAGGDTAGGATPLGALGGVGTGVAQGHRASGSFTEHGYVIGLACVRADLTYQQGISRLWHRSTKFDFYWPAFAHIGEQAVFRREIYATGNPAFDNLVFGYQERWAEYRHKPNRISGLFRSTSAGTLDVWHLAQRFTAAPTLGDTFIIEDPPVQRVVAVGAQAQGKEFLFDGLFEVRMVRPIPAFGVPGLADHF